MIRLALALLAAGCSLPVTDLDPTPLVCGWMVEPLGQDGAEFIAPAGQCVRLRAAPGDLLAPEETDPCDVTSVGRTCVVLRPGDRMSVFGKVGSSGSTGDMERGDEPCELSCP